MFPLGTVLVPGAPLPLHVFEPRYRALMDVVMATDAREFGVVLIERGSEVGGGDVRSSFGTTARIVQAEQFGDGRWALIAIGGRRIDVITWLSDDPYPRAVVATRAEGTWNERCNEALAAAERAVRRALAMTAELGERAAPATVELDPAPVLRSWQLVGVAPIPTFDRHALLGCDDPLVRLQRLLAMTEESVAVLAQRMRGL